MVAGIEDIALETRACGGRALLVQSTYSLAKALIEENIPGDFVECGVYAGSHPAAMAKAIMESGQVGRKVHLFDSFRGIPMAGPKDRDWNAGDPEGRPFGKPGVAERISSGISICTCATVVSNMDAWGIDQSILVYHKGWFHDTVSVSGIDQIALLRLDGDLYESTRVCLEHLYPKVVSGGWCICDDWTLDGCREAVMPYLLLRESCPIYWRVEK